MKKRDDIVLADGTRIEVEVDEPGRHSRLVLKQLAHLIEAGQVEGLEPGQAGFEREATVH